MCSFWLNFRNKIAKDKWDASKIHASSRNACQIWEARAQVTKRIPQTQRIRSVARKGKRKFEFLAVRDVEGREHWGNPARNAGMNSKRAEWWKPIKCILCTYTAAVLPLSYLCIARRCIAPTNTCLHLAHRVPITLYVERSISMRVYRCRRLIAKIFKHCMNAWRFL